jgi:hypothetical protein
MATMPPVNLGVILFLSFLAVWASRKPLERLFVLPAARTSQPKRQLIMDLFLCMVAGLLAAAFNIIVFGFPVGSGIKLIIGCGVAGFFLSIDTALARERVVIKDSIARDDLIAPPEKLFSMTKKFSLVALATAVLVSIVLLMVFSLDIVWLTGVEQNAAALRQAQMSIAYEIFFMFLVLLSLVINLIISYSGNLRLFFKNETHILERISHGDLSLGVIGNYSYSEYTLKDWEPGSVLVVGTDGVRETRSSAGEMFGLSRLQEVISHNVGAPAEVIQNSIIDALRDFQADATQEDDITLVIIKLL